MKMIGKPIFTFQLHNALFHWGPHSHLATNHSRAQWCCNCCCIYGPRCFIFADDRSWPGEREIFKCVIRYCIKDILHDLCLLWWNYSMFSLLIKDESCSCIWQSCTYDLILCEREAQTLSVHNKLIIEVKFKGKL